MMTGAAQATAPAAAACLINVRRSSPTRGEADSSSWRGSSTPCPSRALASSVGSRRVVTLYVVRSQVIGYRYRFGNVARGRSRTPRVRRSGGVAHGRRRESSGSGYVGLPLAIAYAEEGFRTLGLDVDAARLRPCGRLEPHRRRPRRPARRGRRSRRLPAHHRAGACSRGADAIYLCVPDPVRRRPPARPLLRPRGRRRQWARCSRPARS